MNTNAKYILVALAMIPLAAGGQEEKKLSCIKDVAYNKEFLDAYPKAPAACRSVQVKDGQKWVQFVGEVTKRKDNEVTVSMENAVGDSLGEVTFAPTAEAKVSMEGKEKTYSSLRVGDKFEMYVPENRFGFYAEPGAGTIKELPIVKRVPANK
jgi:hypothetical protein